MLHEKMIPGRYKVVLGQMAKTEYRVQIMAKDGSRMDHFAVLSAPTYTSEIIATAEVMAQSQNMLRVLETLIDAMPKNAAIRNMFSEKLLGALGAADILLDFIDAKINKGER